jgi:hypothetical protein
MGDQPEIMPAEGAQERPESQRPARPALTINVQSWATPIVGVIMLAMGLAAGYFGRPLVDPGPTASPQVAASTTSGGDPGAGVSGDQEARQQALMEALIPQTLHFKGDPDAPVTLIEFGDFQ